MDFGARNYETSLGRWMNIDPLADNYLNYSPYNYTMNNPTLYIDPDGMAVWKPNGDGTYTAEAGDSAATLAEDAGISLDQANEIVQNQLGENYLGEDGELKSDVEIGDTVAVPEQVKAFQAEQEAIVQNKVEIAKIDIEIQKTESEITSEQKELNTRDSLNKREKLSLDVFDKTMVSGVKASDRSADDGSAAAHIGQSMLYGWMLKRLKTKQAKADSIRKKVGDLKGKKDSLTKEKTKRTN